MIKKISLAVIILVVVLLVMTADIRKDGPTASAQRLTNTAEVSRDPVLAAVGSYRHVVYVDDDKLYYRRNTSSGASGSWETAVWIASTGVSTWDRPIGICAEGSYVYIVMGWRYSASDNYEIWIKRSTDNGATWDSWLRLTTNSGESQRPKVACSGQYVYVFWQDDNPGNYEVYFKRSTNYGVSFGSPVRLSYSAGASHYPTICAAGAYVYVAWQDNNPGNYEIYFKGSGNYGASFGSIWRVTYNSGMSWCPSLSCDSTGQYVYLAWSDNNPGNFEVFFKRNTSYGTGGGWGGPLRMSYTSGSTYFPHVDNGGGLVDVIWADNNPGNWEIISKASSTNGSSFGAAARWTYNSGGSYLPQIYSAGWDIVWEDDNPGNKEIFFKQ